LIYEAAQALISNEFFSR